MFYVCFGSGRWTTLHEVERSRRVGENGCIEPTSGTCGYLIRDPESSDLVREEHWSVQNKRGSDHFKHCDEKPLSRGQGQAWKPTELGVLPKPHHSDFKRRA